jgi:hypothetical protein
MVAVNREDLGLNGSLVYDFMEKFGQLETEPEFWDKLIDEEHKEVIEAFEHLIKELTDLTYVSIARAIVSGEIYKSAEDVQQRWNNFQEAKWQSEAFLRVHESNMSKLDDNGKPIYREDGKVLKGPNYKAPDMSGLI